jgi:hypothetical protein
LLSQPRLVAKTVGSQAGHKLMQWSGLFRNGYAILSLEGDPGAPWFATLSLDFSQIQTTPKSKPTTTDSAGFLSTRIDCY